MDDVYLLVPTLPLTFTADTLLVEELLGLLERVLEGDRLTECLEIIFSVCMVGVYCAKITMGLFLTECF